MFRRDYMEYHVDRFHDHSLLFFHGGKLAAILPCNEHDNKLISHGGLTFGGFVTDTRMTAVAMLDCFSILRDYMKVNGLIELLYKKIPYIYCAYPSDEDLYALYVNGAILERRDLTSCIYIPARLEFSTLRKRKVKKASGEKVDVVESTDYDGFFLILDRMLRDDHQTTPTHSAKEMKLLASRHPENIRLFAATMHDQMVAGVIVYETSFVAHTQYLVNSPEGKRTGALDLIIEFLIKERYRNIRFFDFGISNESHGLILNEGLIFYKQGFGARGIAHDFYKLSVYSIKSK
jgi:hypothetical protein